MHFQIKSPLKSAAKSNKRLERTRHERAALLSCVGEPLKRNVRCSLDLRSDASLSDFSDMRTHAHGYAYRDGVFGAGVSRYSEDSVVAVHIPCSGHAAREHRHTRTSYL